jgi:hypothetical protein
VAVRARGARGGHAARDHRGGVRAGGEHGARRAEAPAPRRQRERREPALVRALHVDARVDDGADRGRVAGGCRGEERARAVLARRVLRRAAPGRRLDGQRPKRHARAFRVEETEHGVRPSRFAQPRELLAADRSRRELARRVTLAGGRIVVARGVVGILSARFGARRDGARRVRRFRRQRQPPRARRARD